MARYDGKSEFVKAANSRLNDARLLLDASKQAKPAERHTQGAKYLAGYAVECILKVYIIHAQDANTLVEAVQRLREREQKRPNPRAIPDLMGAPGHQLRTLLSLTDLEGHYEARSELGRAWNICLRWDSTWRYSPKQPPYEDAKEFVEAVETVYRWVKSKL